MNTFVRISICLLAIVLVSCNKNKKTEAALTQNEVSHLSAPSITKAAVIPISSSPQQRAEVKSSSKLITSQSPTASANKPFPVVSFNECKQICERILKCGVGSFDNQEECENGCDSAMDDKRTKKHYQCLGKATSCVAVKQCDSSDISSKQKSEFIEKEASLSQLDLTKTTIIFQHIGRCETPVLTLILTPSPLEKNSPYEKQYGPQEFTQTAVLSTTARAQWIHNLPVTPTEPKKSRARGTFAIIFLDGKQKIVLTKNRESSRKLIDSLWKQTQKDPADEKAQQALDTLLTELF